MKRVLWVLGLVLGFWLGGKGVATQPVAAALADEIYAGATWSPVRAGDYYQPPKDVYHIAGGPTTWLDYLTGGPGKNAFAHIGPFMHTVTPNVPGGQFNVTRNEGRFSFSSSILGDYLIRFYRPTSSTSGYVITETFTIHVVEAPTGAVTTPLDGQTLLARYPVPFFWVDEAGHRFYQTDTVSLLNGVTRLGSSSSLPLTWRGFGAIDGLSSYPATVVLTTASLNARASFSLINDRLPDQMLSSPDPITLNAPIVPPVGPNDTLTYQWKLNNVIMSTNASLTLPGGTNRTGMYVLTIDYRTSGNVPETITIIVTVTERAPTTPKLTFGTPRTPRENPVPLQLSPAIQREGATIPLMFDALTIAAEGQWHLTLAVTLPEGIVGQVMLGAIASGQAIGANQSLEITGTGPTMLDFAEATLKLPPQVPVTAGRFQVVLNARIRTGE